MRRSDPDEIPEHDWLQPTHHLDWPAMAAKLVRDVLKLERHERVLLSADPYCGGAMLDAVRQEIQRAGGIELATILHWTPALTRLIEPCLVPGGCLSELGQDMPLRFSGRMARTRL
jgi:hypothetical protein